MEDISTRCTEDSRLNKALMTQFPYARGREYVCKNIGDYVQAVASRQFAGYEAPTIEQEEANTYCSPNGKKTRLIMNGWFQWRVENWPPSDDIEPLLISMHISPLKAKELLSEEGIVFLKKNSPVGCRDIYTRDLLKEHGIEAYFSGCMTLTLGNRFAPASSEERSGIYFVDPYFELPPVSAAEGASFIRSVANGMKFLPHYLKNRKTINELAKKQFFTDYSPTGFLDRNRGKFRPYFKAAVFHKTYCKAFSDELLRSAEYITHWVDVDMSGAVTTYDLLDAAESLIEKYAHAQLLVTSRIHAGLPALGCGTPVIFITDDEVTSMDGSFNTPGRLDGLLQLFRTASISVEGMNTQDDVLGTVSLIDKDFTFNNKGEWEHLARDLAAKAAAFMA